MRKFMVVFIAIMMVLGLAACNGGAPAGEQPLGTGESSSGAGEQLTDMESESEPIFKVGISMPTKSLQRWNEDGANMQSQFEALGYEVDLQYGGDNDVATQISQIESMITGGCQALIIAAIDSGTLTEVLKGAKDKNIPVIAYDRFIMETDAVSYYLSFDNSKTGAFQGQFIVNALKPDAATEPLNIELFIGDPGDANAGFFFTRGAMPVLQPYIDSGKLVVKSGQTSRADCSTPGWRSADAQARMENLISQFGYSPTGTPLAAVYSINDSIAQGITNALINAGFTADNFPIITGQDCDKASVINMRNGVQTMSVIKDTRTLAAAAVKMVQEIQSGGTATVNDTASYDNGTGIIPSFLCDPEVYTIKDIGKKLIDRGYYTWDDIGGAKGTMPFDYLIQ